MESVGKLLWMMTILVIWGQIYGCLEQEKVALLQLKAYLGDPILLDSWNEEGKMSNCCDNWKGVTCAPNQRVVSIVLDMSNNNVATVRPNFNASILVPFEQLRELILTYTDIESWEEDKGAPKLSSSLKNLELLNFQYNNFNSSILSKLRGFSSLKYLYIESNNLTGPIEVHDIEAIGQNLKELDLSSNWITGFLNYNGSTKLSSRLKVLDLKRNILDKNIISQVATAFPSLHSLILCGSIWTSSTIQLNALQQLKHLEVLDLSINELRGFFPLNGSTKLSSKLKVLNLGDNELDNNIIISQLTTAFPSLHSLNLGWNKLTGTFPIHALQQLKNLEVLDLSQNQLRGFFPLNGSTKLSSKLKVLHLGDNKLDNNIITSQLTTAFPSLHSLNLGLNKLTGTFPIHVLQRLNSLEVLDLSHNNITGFTNYNASFNRGLITSLQELDISDNQLAGIPVWFQNLTSLETLDISANQFTGNIGSSPLVHLLSLKDLRISYNHFKIPDTFQPFANHTRLKYFVGDSNHVFQDHVSKQPPFSQGLQLQALSLSDCSLFTYPHFLHHQRNMRLIDLSYNLLYGKFPVWLLENNIRLNTIILTNNSINGSLHRPFLLHAHHLSRIYIDKNKIQGHIPANIGTIFPKLVELDLSNNQLEGYIPSSLCEVQSLKYLYLSNNHLSGKIDHVSENCNNLIHLDLSNNHFVGKISSFHASIFGPSLEVLNLSNNSLSGFLPKDIFNFSKSLSAMDLSFNRLEGPLPNCSGSTNADYLYLNNNRLSGHVTDTFLNFFFGLSSLDLSYNDLRGHIPAAIGNLTDLNALVLKGNQFHGQIPLQLCNLVQLGILDLSYNDLHGPIPACLGQIKSPGISEIGTYDITFGATKGKLESLIDEKVEEFYNTFENKVEFTTKNMAYRYEGMRLYYITGIDLSSNKLTGQIPHELGNISNLHALNISHNKLWGPIPATLSDLKNIESLDLSYNQLSGSIPPLLTNLDTLGVFNVAHNNLSGRIPVEGHSLTFDASSYQGNPFLCGPPLSKNCTIGESPPHKYR